MTKSIKNSFITVILLIVSYWLFIYDPSETFTKAGKASTSQNTNEQLSTSQEIEEEIKLETVTEIPNNNNVAVSKNENNEIPDDLKAQLNAPAPELPEDLKRQLELPPQELPEDLKAQLNAPPPELPEDIKNALKQEPRVVSLEEVNGVNQESGDE